MNKINRISPAHIVFAVFFVLIAVYGFLRAKNILTGPSIEVSSPKPNEQMEKVLLEINGRAGNISKLFLDGRVIFVDEEGNFKEKLLLAPGYNILEIKALDRFGREVKKNIKTAYK